MHTEDIEALTQALHRKLLNYGKDIRACRKAQSSELKALLEKRKEVDKTYSACLNNLKEPDPVIQEKDYHIHRAAYQTL